MADSRSAPEGVRRFESCPPHDFTEEIRLKTGILKYHKMKGGEKKDESNPGSI